MFHHPILQSHVSSQEMNFNKTVTRKIHIIYIRETYQCGGRIEKKCGDYPLVLIIKPCIVFVASLLCEYIFPSLKLSLSRS
jgi:hypothetical protein